MELIERIAESVGLDSNVILFSFLIAVFAITCIVALVVCLLVVSIRKKLRDNQDDPLQKTKQQEPAGASLADRIRMNRAAEAPVKETPQQLPSFEQNAFSGHSAPPVEHPVYQPEVPRQTATVPAAEPKPAPVSPAVGYAPAKPEPVSASPASEQIPQQVPVVKPSSPVGATSKPVSSSEPAAKPAPELQEEQLNHVADAMIVQKDQKTAERKAKIDKSAEKKGKQSKSAKKALKQKAKKLSIPRSVQDTIPYKRVYPDTGIIEIADGIFSKSYQLDDVNYQAAKDEDQTVMFLKYCELINSFDSSTRFQITINQKNINLSEFEALTMLPMEGDTLDELRVERNEMILDKIQEGRNKLEKEKYLTISIPAPDYEAAKTMFARLDSEIIENVNKIGGAGAHPLSTAQRLEILHDIYNPDSVGMFGNNFVLDANGYPVMDKEKFRFDIMRRMGMTTKDMIGPDSIQINGSYGMIGQTYFRALFAPVFPQELRDDFLKELTDLESNMLTSLIFQPVDTQSALKMARNNIRNVNANLMKQQQAASKSGHSIELVNPELKEASDEAIELRDDLTRKDQKLFYMTLVIVLFADSKEQLELDTKSLQAIGRIHGVNNIKSLGWQQQNGLNSALPLCHNQLEVKRSLTTESCAVFMPFVNQELFDRDGGMYYGNNAVSHNLILLNRRNCKNGNGFIFGTPGSGKSMSAKQEMLTVLLSSGDDVVVIDPEGEYEPMAEMLGNEVAEVIRVEPGSNVHINPFDIDLNCEGEDNPITAKADFIGTLCETIVGDRFGLTPGQRSLIDRCVQHAYGPYLNSLDPVTGLYDKSKLPTLKSFYNILRDVHNNYDATQLADALEIYVTGSQNLFAYPTNVEYSKRFVVYDIKKIGNSMKSLGFLVVLDNIWNRIVEGRQKGKFTWIFIDEIYLLFKLESSAEFLKNLYKRARKYGGIPTGITQNVTDLLENPTARTMISNCEYIQMLNQAAMDGAPLAELLNISQTQMGYITNAAPGHGLIYDGHTLVPFVNSLPKDTKMYRAMTTKLSEVKERERLREEQLASRAGESTA